MNKSELKLIRQINAEGWAKYGDKLFIEKDIAPTVRKIAELALNEEADQFTDAERGKIRAALDTGEYDKRIKEEDPEVAKEFEEYVTKRIKEEIDKGNLSDPDKANKKGKQYNRRIKNDNK